MTLYEDLGVPADSDPVSIKRAYKRKAAKAHPDREGGSTEAFQVLSRAYAVLSDDSKRKRYDETGLDTELPSIEAAAQNQLAALFAQLIEANDPETTPFIEKLKQVCAAGQQQARQLLHGQETRIKKLSSARKRLSRRPVAGSNFLLLALEQQIKTANGNLEGIKHNIALGDEMLRLLADYTYTAEPPPEVTFQTFSFTTR